MRGKKMITEYNHLYDRLMKLGMLREKTDSIEMKQFIDDEIYFVKNKMKGLELKIRESQIENDWTECLEMINK